MGKPSLKGKAIMGKRVAGHHGSSGSAVKPVGGRSPKNPGVGGRVTGHRA
jgi:hypothetical protein